mmetsp:Transcript_36341/g.86309  ORF Transcript_36341/g.86309 Transcript_36341/m.86309 type:complete len:200 (+) Transcript_36341:124-723(+)
MRRPSQANYDFSSLLRNGRRLCQAPEASVPYFLNRAFWIEGAGCQRSPKLGDTAIPSRAAMKMNAVAVPEDSDHPAPLPTCEGTLPPVCRFPCLINVFCRCLANLNHKFLEGLGRGRILHVKADIQVGQGLQGDHEDGQALLCFPIDSALNPVDDLAEQEACVLRPPLLRFEPGIPDPVRELCHFLPRALAVKPLWVRL